MKRALVIGLALWASLAAFAAEAAPPSVAPSPVTARADTLLSAFQPDGPALVVAVSQGGRTVYQRAVGVADLEHGGAATPATSFHAASVSKQFTSLAILMLAKEGKVDLNADIRRYLPYVPDFGQTITVADLMLHTSGLRDQWSLFTLSGVEGQSMRRQPQVVAMVARQTALNFPPGADFNYCNTGYTLLAEIVRATSGLTLREFTTRRIFQPLGMTHSFFYDDARELVPGRAMSYAPGRDDEPQLARLNFETVGATSLVTTTDDLVLWGRELMAPKIIPADLIAQLKAPGRLRDGAPLNYGFGLLIGEDAGHRSIGHGGSDAGYRAMFLTFPKEDTVIAVLAAGQQSSQEIADGLADIFLNGGSGAAKPAGAQPAEAALTALAGDYVNDWRSGMRLEVRGGRLIRSTIDGPDAPALFRPDGGFTIGSGTAVFRPVYDDQRRLVALSETTAWGGHPLLHRPAKLATPTLAELKALAGRYRSDELDVTYDFTVMDGRLTASSLRHPEPVVFQASDQDRFESAYLGRATVRRGADGAVVGLSLDAGGGRVLKLALKKIVAGQ